MKKLVMAFALALTVLGGTTAAATLSASSARADNCSGSDCR
ncbi:MAG: hypothetical protein AB7H71_16870 [Alphaproteobacteria bacterium]